MKLIEEYYTIEIKMVNNAKEMEEIYNDIK
jgi:hypothetical protein